ncbi:MAG TPA: DUF1508 domain-containing protein [Roseateles sp.]|jgi:uncharacterized protein YegP (UPF0339 family)
MAKFEIYPDAAGEWRWRLKASNGRIVASGEGYKTPAGAERGTQALRRAAKQAKIKMVKA